jgi:hypothetical protein
MKLPTNALTADRAEDYHVERVEGGDGGSAAPPVSSVFGNAPIVDEVQTLAHMPAAQST